MQGGVNYNGSTLLSGSINVNAGGNIQPLNVEITENGERTITPPAGVDGYAPINIVTNVPQVVPVLETLNVSQNGRYVPPEGVAGFDEVNVNVLHPLDTLSVTENGSYEPPTGVYGFSNVNVNVPQPIVLSNNGFFTLLNENTNVNGYVQTTPEVFSTTWNGGANIGHCLLGNIPISGYNKFKFSVENVGDNYQHRNNNTNISFDLGFIVTNTRQTYYPQMASINPNIVVAMKHYSGIDLYNHSLDDFIDLSEYSGNYYLNMCMYGYELTNVLLTLE